MGVWKQLKNLFTRPVVNWDFLDIPTTIVLGQTPADLYATQPHLRTVVSFRARNVAQLGLQAFARVSDTDRQRVTDDPLVAVLSRPNPTMTRYELLERLVMDLDLYDTAYWVVIADADSTSGWRIQPVPPSWVTTIKGKDIFQPDMYVVEPGNGNRIEIPAEDMLVFHGPNPDNPAQGLSPVGALKDVLAEQIDAWKFRRQMWERGGRIGAYLARPKDAPSWDKDSRERFERGWKDFQNKGAKAGSTPLLEDGMELKRVGFNAREEQFSEVTKLSLQTVASIYHVNPVMVGVLDNANFSNTREFRKMLYSETLGPLLVMIQDRLNTFLVPKIGTTESLYLEFNIAAKLAGDFEEQASVLSTLVGRPILSLNEGRAKLNYSARDDGDTVITPLNVTEGGQASPQDGGLPPGKSTGKIISEWQDRLERSVAPRLATGREVDWGRWARELKDDFEAIGVDSRSAGEWAADLTQDQKEAHNAG